MGLAWACGGAGLANAGWSGLKDEMQNSPGILSRLQVVGLSWAISTAARTEGRKSRGGSGLRLWASKHKQAKREKEG
jgi:hypothetical protein